LAESRLLKPCQHNYERPVERPVIGPRDDAIALAFEPRRGDVVTARVQVANGVVVSHWRGFWTVPPGAPARFILGGGLAQRRRRAELLWPHRRF
jgi:hypothetical protein